MKFLKLFLLTAVVAPVSMSSCQLDLSDVAGLAEAAKEKIRSMPLAEKLARLAEQPEVQEAISGAIEKAKSSPVVQKIAKVVSTLSVPEALEILKVRAEAGKPTVAEAYKAAVSPDKKIAILREAVGLIGEGVEPSGVSEKKKEGLQAITALAEELKKSGKVTTDSPELYDSLQEVFRRIKYTLS